jgi:hypothetical protein
MKKKLLIIGGNNSLGGCLITKFKNSINNIWEISSLDFEKNILAEKNIILDNIFSEDSIIKDEFIIDSIGNDYKYDSIICLAEENKEISFDNKSILTTTKKLISNNFNSKLLTLHLANKYLSNNSLLVFRFNKFKKLEDENKSIISIVSKLEIDLVDTFINYPQLLPNNTKIVKLNMNVNNSLSDYDSICTKLVIWSENAKNAKKNLELI